MERKKSFLQGALILGIAGVLSRILGAFYRIPLARLIGSEGMGLYQMAYPIYTTILALATAGVPVAISIMVARKESEGYNGDIRKIFRVALILLFGVGLALSIIVFMSSGWLARNLLMQPKAMLPVAAIAPAIVFAGLLSVFRGYFQGHQWMTPTAVSQVVEQIIRVTFILVLANLLFARGLPVAVAGATFGAVLGAVAGLIILIIYYWNFRRQQPRTPELVYSGESSWALGKELFLLAVPVSLGAVVVPLVQMLDASIVPGRLISAGYTAAQATALYGELSGMASVLINLPAIFTIALGTSLVPAIAEALSLNDRNSVSEKINNGMRIALMIALPAAAGLSVLAYPITDLLFDVWRAGRPLQVMAIAVVVLATFQISSSSLQGMGHPEIPLRNLVVAGILKVIFNYTLTGIPSINIVGPAIGTILAFLAASTLNMISLTKRISIRYAWGSYIKILLATLLMALVAHYSYSGMVSADLNAKIATLAAISAGGAVYAIALFAVGELDMETLRALRRRKG